MMRLQGERVFKKKNKEKGKDIEREVVSAKE